MPYPGPWTIVSLMVEALFGSFFYLYGRHERTYAWPWAVLSFAVWAVAAFLLHWGLIAQVLVQLGIVALLTLLSMLRPHKAQIIR